MSEMDASQGGMTRRSSQPPSSQTHPEALSPGEVDPDRRGSADSSFRPEIQGLRAIAVGMVVLFHLWPARVRGGYVGVDVFFVISGYLITAHILREVAETGTVNVTRFWARRIRRLLPASLVVLALSAVAVLLWGPSTIWATSGRQIAASALYVQNWALASDAVDYMALDNVPTVAQHYWSLSVEEQFYLVWPLLVIGLLSLQRLIRRARHAQSAAAADRRRQTMIAGLATLAVASLTWSAISTAQDQPFAYLSTFTRAWEFAAGALGSLVVVRLPVRMARVVGWLGGVGIMVAGLVYTESSAFPGWIALLPVLGTMAVILAGSGGGPSTAGWWLARRPATFLGDISYSVYLVHWPLIVIVPYVTGHRLTWTEKLVLIGATMVLAWGSKTWVEDPLRTRPLLAARPWRAYAFAAAGMAVFVAANVGLTVRLDHQDAATARLVAQRVESGAPCLGPGALDPEHRCDPISGIGALIATPDVVVRQSSSDRFRQCQRSLDGPELITCHLGEQARPTRTIALIGDSHASAWVPMMDALGKRRGWSVVVHTKGSCPFSDARRVLPTETTDARAVSCDTFNAAAESSILTDPAITDVFVASYTSSYAWTSAPGRPVPDPGVEGFVSAWQRLAAAGKRVHVLRDVPATIGTSIPSCIAAHPDHPERCANPRGPALGVDLAVEAVQRLGSPKVTLIDLTPQFCDLRLCYAQVGDVIVYRDTSHLSIEYSELLAPFVDRAAGIPS